MLARHAHDEKRRETQESRTGLLHHNSSQSSPSGGGAGYQRDEITSRDHQKSHHMLLKGISVLAALTLLSCILLARPGVYIFQSKDFSRSGGGPHEKPHHTPVKATKAAADAALSEVNHLTSERNHASKNHHHSSNQQINEQQQKKSESRLDYSCPENVDKSLNDKNDEFSEYLNDDARFRPSTFTKSTYLHMKHDAWGIPYKVIRSLLTPWKIEAFGNVHSGDVIYESACGTGLNALMTAEILQQELHVSNVTFYGNDYLPPSVAIARQVWESEPAQLTGSQAARFCAGDSTNLSFVPAGVFDAVYTGYIDPVMDPLNLLPPNATTMEKYEHSVKYCRSDNPEHVGLAQRAQTVQEEWYAMWVREMLRIVKPGGIVVMESNAESLCKDTGDWGGVDKIWWRRAWRKYGWEVEDGSLIMRDMPREKGWRFNRYHVLMRKKLD